MSRTKYQPGPETGHYHDTLGVDETPAEQLGQTQQVSLIGPFAITHSSTDLYQVGANLSSIPSDAVVITAWMEITTEWAFPDIGVLIVALAPASDPSNWWAVVTYDAVPGVNIIQTQGDAAVVLEASSGAVDPGGGEPRRSVGRLVGPGVLVALALGAQAPTAGAANVYALIATAS